MSDRVLIVEDDPEVAEAIAEGLAHCGRDAIVCYDTEAAELVLEHVRPEHVISDVRLTGPFRGGAPTGANVEAFHSMAGREQA